VGGQCRRLAGAIAALALSTPVTAAPQRVVSINLCADQFVVALADPTQIAALSPLAADPALSAVADRAEKFPRIRPNAESVLARNPDLVVAGAWGGREAEAILAARGIPVLRLPLAEDFPAIRAQLMQLGAALGQTARAAAMLSELDLRLAAIRPAAAEKTLVWLAAGFTPGTGTLADAVLHAAGRANAAPFAGYGTVRLEALVINPPALLVLPARAQGAGTSLSETLLAHPAIRPIETVRIEPAWLACGSFETVRAVEALAR
jgi:iron complex transport system substrate-binding protein